MKPAGFPRTLAKEPHITNDLQKSLDFNHSKTMKLIIYKRSILNKVSINRNTPETRLCVDQFREIGSEAHKNLTLYFPEEHGLGCADSVLTETLWNVSVKMRIDYNTDI